MTASEWYLAGDHDDVWRWLDIGDLATFIGFAGGGADAKSRWWDQKRSFPIGRLASLSSHPGVAFEHPSIVTADAEDSCPVCRLRGRAEVRCSVTRSGVAALGSASRALTTTWRSPRIIGIMSGHLVAEEGGLFDYSGLSYYTRAPSIDALIKVARASGFVNEKPTPLRLSRARSRRLKQTRARAIDGRRRLPIAHAVRQPMQTPSAP